jgi:hypothetical protein
MAQAIRRALAADAQLRPEDIAVVAPDARLLPFAERVLGEQGLPVQAAAPAARHTPVVRGALLALRWAHWGPSALLEQQLLDLPYVAVEALDRHQLLTAAALLERPILALAPEELRPLGLRPATLQQLDRLRTMLGGLNPAAGIAELIESAAAGLAPRPGCRAMRRPPLPSRPNCVSPGGESSKPGSIWCANWKRSWLSSRRGRTT